MDLVNIRTGESGQKEYYCPIDGWVQPKTVNLTGFSEHVCPYCDWELNDNPNGDLAKEQEKDEKVQE